MVLIVVLKVAQQETARWLYLP